MPETCLFFDCFSGAAGDMLLGSLLDFGAPLDRLNEDLTRLGIPGLRVQSEKAWQGGLAGTRVRVTAKEATQRFRFLPEILSLLDQSGLSAAIQEPARRVFRRLAEAEAKVHGCSVEEVHFHEVGAVDSIGDIVGFCSLWAALESPTILCSPLAVGEGFVDSEHGSIPVPAMATLELLRGVPVEMSGLREELVTPTGAALLSTLCSQFGRHGSVTPRAIGYGLGTRVRESPPNAVRAILCERSGESQERVWAVETNLDDATGQELGHLLQRCFDLGALDVTVVAAQMKKGRPGHVVQVLTDEARRSVLEELLLAESPTLGVRRHVVERRILPREELLLATPWGEVRVKAHQDPRGRRHVVPEFDELVRLKKETGLSFDELRHELISIAGKESQRPPAKN
jgi:hypothetical protein